MSSSIFPTTKGFIKAYIIHLWLDASLNMNISPKLTQGFGGNKINIKF